MAQNKERRKLGFGGENRGMPGYRTRLNRSGLDPLDTSAESAYIEGMFLRRLFTLKVRARNLIQLGMMFILGVVPFPIFAYFFINIPIQGFQNNRVSFSLIGSIAFGLFILGILTAVTGALSVNFLLSILEIFKLIPKSKIVFSANNGKTRKKKLPKRRKDYK